MRDWSWLARDESGNVILPDCEIIQAEYFKDRLMWDAHDAIPDSSTSHLPSRLVLAAFLLAVPVGCVVSYFVF
jgi:hypothetical protein